MTSEQASQFELPTEAGARFKAKPALRTLTESEREGREAPSFMFRTYSGGEGLTLYRMGRTDYFLTAEEVLEEFKDFVIIEGKG
jgi:hypothetical protein